MCVNYSLRRFVSLPTVEVCDRAAWSDCLNVALEFRNNNEEVSRTCEGVLSIWIDNMRCAIATPHDERHSHQPAACCATARHPPGFSRSDCCSSVVPSFAGFPLRNSLNPWRMLMMGKRRVVVTTAVHTTRKKGSLNADRQHQQ